MTEIIKLFAENLWFGVGTCLILFVVFTIIGMFIRENKYDNDSVPREFKARYIMFFLYFLSVSVTVFLVLFGFSFYQVAEADIIIKSVLTIIGILGIIISLLALNELKEFREE